MKHNRTIEFSKLFSDEPRNGIYKPGEFMGRGVNLLRMGELFENDYINSAKSDFEKISLTEAEKERLLLDEGDLLFSRTSLVAKGVGKCSIVASVSEELTYDSNLIRIRLNKSRADPRYYYFYFSSPNGRNQVRTLSSGVAVTTITARKLGSLIVPFPEYDIQRKIARVLGFFDDLIEVNLQRIKILEEICQSLYDEWFVHFRYPGHEKTEIIQTHHGRIPKGWEYRQLGEVTNNYDRKRIPLSVMERSRRKGAYPYYGAAKVLDYIDDYIFDGRYLLIAEDGSVITPDGYPVLQLVDGKFWANNHTHIVQAKHPLSTNYLYLYLKNFYIMGYVTGTAQPKINQTNLNRIPILVPSIEITEMFNDYVENIFNLMDTYARKNDLLMKTRDLLIPPVVSGKINVNEVNIDHPSD